MRTLRRALLLLPALTRPAAAQQPPAPRPPLPQPQLAPGLQALPGGGWRLTFARDEDRATPEQRLTLMEIGNILAATTTGRVTLWAEAANGEDVSELRRLALRRALAVRDAMALGGLPETRVDLRPLGRTAAARDVVDIMPPAVTRP
jgi:outer membrane protein OmpA-like peptidoglycan-associated protein